VTDAEAVAMSRHLAREDGLFLGSSAAVNLVTCVKLAQSWGKKSGKTVVTILCDSGTRHYSRFWNDEYLCKEGIPVTSSIEGLFNLDKENSREKKLSEVMPGEIPTGLPQVE
jgi:cysteine synthase A